MPKLVKQVQSADGTRIYADATGDPANNALVFVHGFSGSSAAFDPIFSNPQNSKEFFLVRYDVRGHGRSGKPGTPEGYSSQRFAEDFKAVCTAFEVKKPIFIGWSMGAKILADIATYLPSNTLLGTVSLAGSPYFDPKMATITSKAMNSIVPGLLKLDDAIVQQNASVAGIRLLFLRNPDPSSEFLEETIEAIAEGANLVQDNPDVSWETR